MLFERLHELSDWLPDHVYALFWLCSEGSLVRDLGAGKVGKLVGIDLKVGRLKLTDWDNARTWQARPTQVYDM